MRTEREDFFACGIWFADRHSLPGNPVVSFFIITCHLVVTLLSTMDLTCCATGIIYVQPYIFYLNQHNVFHVLKTKFVWGPNGRKFLLTVSSTTNIWLLPTRQTICFPTVFFTCLCGISHTMYFLSWLPVCLVDCLSLAAQLTALTGSLNPKQHSSLVLSTNNESLQWMSLMY